VIRGEWSSYVRGMDTRTLLDAVAESFARTGATTPPWPDPHPDMGGPLEEEYSRCLDPGKYRILGARAEAWAQALTGLGLAVVEEVGDPVTAWREPSGNDMDRVLRLRPFRAQAVPLVLGFRAMDGVPGAVVEIGAGEPAVPAETLPQCGCDACDGGSDEFIEDFDRHVLAVVNGEFVHLGKKGNTLVSTGDGWSASGEFAGRRRGDIEGLLRDARAGRSRHGAVHGARWW